MDDTTDCDFLSADELNALLPGFRLDPEPLRSTAMSRVYLAADTRLHDRKVAVKIMADYLAEVPGFRKRFRREIKLMADLEHPNIMYVIAAAGTEDRLLYFVMPRAEEDLRARLADGALDPAATARVIAQVASALDFAHARGVVHRDVKPANILFGAGDHVYLSDFGVAKPVAGEDLTRAGDSIGTSRYTAPEVYGASRSAGSGTDDPHDRSGDVYSLGAVLFHCLTGERPFHEVDDFTVARLQRDGEVPRIAELRPGLPPEFDAIAAKAMSLDPARRYRTCGELAAAFSQAVDRIESEDGSPDGGEAPSRRRNPVLAVAGLVAGLVLGGVLSYQALGTDAGADALYAVTEGSVEPATPDPVTGEDQVERAPAAGECLTSDEHYVVVACESSAAVKRVYRIVTDPEDPNPQQPQHEDAAWAACGSESVEFDYHWADSAVREEREWNPETDRIYYFICYQEL
ncbi:serine/threonine-protein kinase [Glycomyces harbinensis]|uniref:non-specific serine/threonine protein kinase n=1 Tax=Glycomyces harbinensis TaxID=58114 RepID=A0A1G6UDJ9_9ACTN|nr:serine/threonine-protein kinase [Glycomyces harbinensis]SDD38645.1 serine/threonine protein kinase [Glycomyces harbinensis]